MKLSFRLILSGQELAPSGEKSIRGGFGERKTKALSSGGGS